MPTDLQIEEEVDSTTDVDVDDTPRVDAGDKYCHIDDGSGFQTYCGRLEPVDGASCRPYITGEPICLSCGRVNCPTCMEMSGLNESLEEM